MSDEAATEGAAEAPAPAVTEDGKVHVQAPDGSFGTIPIAKAAQAAAHGYRVEGAQEYAARQYEEREGALGGVKAFAENAASSGTLGLSDVAAGAIGGNEYRQNRALRELAYPTASTAGEVAGMVLPSLLPGGAEAEAAHAAEGAAEGASLLSRAAGAAGTAARYSPAGLALRGGEAASELVGHGLGAIGLTGESLLGRTAASGLKMAAGGAVEGAAFGAGGALSEAALAPDGDYDGLAQKLWAGAIHGAEFGATVGGALGVGGELAGAAARKIGGTFSARRSLEELADAKTLKSAGFTGGDIAKISRDNPGRVRELADALRGEEGIGWADTLSDRATKLEAARKEVGETLSTMRKSLDEARAPGDGVNVRGVLDNARAKVDELRTAAKTTTDDRIAAKFSRELERMQKGFAEGEPASFEAAHELRRKLDDELTNYGRRTYPASGAKRPPDGFERQLIQLRTDLEHQFEADAERVMSRTTPEFRAQYTDAKARYGALKEITNVSKKRVGMLAGNRDVSLTDTMAGLTGFATMGPAGLLAAAANRALRSTQADHVVGKLAAELAKLDAHVEGAAGRWANRSRKAAHGAEAAAEAVPVRHSVVKQALEKAHEVGKVTTSSTLHVRSEAGEQRERVEEYFRKLRGIEHEANAPEGTLVHMPEAPETAKAAEKVRRNAAAWLLGQAPKSPAQIEHPLIARIARQMKPDPVEVMRFMRKVKTVEDPTSAVDAFERGRLTRDQVDALKATAPAVLEMLRRAVIAKVTESNADVAYQDRVQLSILLNVVADPSMRPEAIAAGQATYANMRGSGGGAGPAPQGAPAQTSAPGKAPRGTSSRVDDLEEGNVF